MIISQNILWRNGIVVFKVKITANLKMLMNVCPHDIFWIATSLTTKVGMVMHHYEPDCLPKRLVCYLQGQGHSEGSHNHNMTVSTIFAELLILLLPNLVWWYIIISQNVLWIKGIVVFKVKVPAKFQNVSECLPRWYFLKRWTFYYQTWYDDASLWARLSFKKIGLLSLSLRSQFKII